MDERIREAYGRAYEGEAKAALRLKLFAAKADREGLPQIARLFRAIAYSEEIHGERALRALRAIGDTESNLKESFEAETRVAGVAYEDFTRLAIEAGDAMAERVFAHSKDVESAHANLYKKALASLIEDRDTGYFVCKVCGYVSDAVLPDVCPVCDVPMDQFVELK
jgi:rubrerythrin